jgi:peptidoglycan/LPS O-acetylase OafA/YrhL
MPSSTPVESRHPARAGYAVAVATELLGGLALLIGFRVRWAAAILAVFCIATALSFHAHFADQNQLFHFLKNIAMAGGMLQIIAFGTAATASTRGARSSQRSAPSCRKPDIQSSVCQVRTIRPSLNSWISTA